jgi:hypothetical protein
MGSVAFAASDSGSVGASLEITGECEVITAAIGATTQNFTATTPVTLITTGNYSGTFDEVPSSINGGAQPTTSAGANPNVAVLCSAGGGDHTVDFSTTANMTGGTSSTSLAWTAKLDGVAFVTQESSATITEDEDSPTLSTYTVTGEVTGQAIADAVPDTYAATVTVTLTY